MTTKVKPFHTNVFSLPLEVMNSVLSFTETATDRNRLACTKSLLTVVANYCGSRFHPERLKRSPVRFNTNDKNLSDETALEEAVFYHKYMEDFYKKAVDETFKFFIDHTRKNIGTFLANNFSDLSKNSQKLAKEFLAKQKGNLVSDDTRDVSTIIFAVSSKEEETDIYFKSRNKKVFCENLACMLSSNLDSKSAVEVLDKNAPNLYRFRGLKTDEHRFIRQIYKVSPHLVKTIASYALRSQEMRKPDEIYFSTYIERMEKLICFSSKFDIRIRRKLFKSFDEYLCCLAKKQAITKETYLNICEKVNFYVLNFQEVYDQFKKLPSNEQDRCFYISSYGKLHEMYSENSVEPMST